MTESDHFGEGVVVEPVGVHKLAVPPQWNQNAKQPEANDRFNAAWVV